ncbi:MAG: prolyl-tRNA synthetase associated domain-containing protein [Synergistaceae bacterium]|nr:prolyl-tRNA synthetase associated domain-containing protein [Synergistaceae bacterium]
MEGKAAALAALEELGIAYEVDEHEPVYTIDEMMALGLHEKGMIVKNLFLRDAKGKRHFLVLVPQDARADLGAIGAKLLCPKLSFASEERLERFLGLKKGAVSPLGVMNDEGHAVEVVVARALTRHDKLGVHPCDNTATVWLSWPDLKKFIERHGNKMRMIDL